MRTRRLMVVAGLGLLATGALGATASRVDAQAPAPTFVGFGAVAQSDGTGTTFGDPGAQPYPVAAGQQNHTEATMSTGPAGYALASTAWPGPLVGNAGSLAVLLGAPPEAGAANYGGRAEASSGGPDEAALPGMAARVEGAAAEATAGSQAVSTGAGANQATTGDSTTTSRSVLEGGVLAARSSSMTSDIAFGGGVVSIGSVYTEALATTDGATSTIGGLTEVSGGQAGGSPFVVDGDGVRFTDPVTGPIGEQMLSQMGMSMFVASPSSTNEGRSASYRAGALVVEWEPPESGQLIVYTFGGSSAEVSARLGTPPSRIPTPTVTAPPATSPRPPPAPAAGGVPAVPSVRPGVPTPTTATFTQPPEVLPVLPAAAFDRNLNWWAPYLVGAGFVLVGSSRLRREQALLDRPVASSPCPLDRRPSSP